MDVNEKGQLEKTKKIETVEENGLKVVIGGWSNLLDKKVKLVAFTGQSNVLGTETPVEEIVKMVKRKLPAVLILVDGAQMVPHMKVDVSKLGIDFLVFSGHKMLGPTGVGVLWGKKEILSGMKPFLFGGDMIGEVKLT
ncbi:MAG: Cysteine desulfurase [Candidatus Collierbacteria bacterium GW2011_GWF1_42_50]|nr:MAG: Cysteine desulfurase [Candidatus Collierbacteria bacterium GW2011_GWF1_42_50]